MNKFKITLFNQEDVFSLIRNFGTSMSLIHGSSLIGSDADLDANLLKEMGLLETQVGSTLKIYFRKHGTFTNFNGDASAYVDCWSVRNEIVGILNIEIESTNTFNIYYEKYE